MRLTQLVNENVLLASGVPRSGQGLYSAAGYSRPWPRNGMDFSAATASPSGPARRCSTRSARSCYEGITLLARLAARARSVELRALGAAAEGIAYESPRGRVRMTDNHLDQSVYLAKADGLMSTCWPTRPGWAARPCPADLDRGLRAQMAASCVVGQAEYARYGACPALLAAIWITKPIDQDPQDTGLGRGLRAITS